MAEFTVIDNIKIETNDRVSIFGRTGTGKTHFAKYWLLPHYPKFVFWDVKRENIDVIHDVVSTTPSELKKHLKTYNKILYQPEIVSDKDFNDMCEIIFENKNTTLCVDEAASVTTPAKIPYWYRMLMTQGRGLDIGVINTSQRPRDVHNSLISESEHLFVFSLNLETDINKIRQQAGEAADEVYYLKEYYFLYYNIRANKSFIFKPIKKYTMDKEGKIEVPQLELYKPKLVDYLSTVS